MVITLGTLALPMIFRTRSRTNAMFSENVGGDLMDSKDGHLEMFLAKTKKSLPLAPYFLKLQ
jgi:hypothetical protein